MNCHRYILVVLFGLLLSSFVLADTVEMSNERTLSGAVVDVTFLPNGAEEEAAYLRGGIEGLEVAEEGDDTLVLAEGEKVEGRLVSLRFRSVGGVLEFSRDDLLSVELVETEMTQALRELAKRKAEVPEDDARKLAELAMWCRDNGLASEARKYARASLALAEEGPFASTAHKALGHVLHEGEWMTPRQAIEQGAQLNEDPDGIPAVDDRDDKELSPEQVKIRDAHRKNNALYQTYLEKANEVRSEELERARTQYSGQFDQLHRQYTQAGERIERLREQHRRDLERYNDDNPIRSGMCTRARAHIRNNRPELPEEVATLTRERTKLAGQLRAIHLSANSARQTISRRHTSRTRSVRNIHSRIRMRLSQDQLVGEEQMTELYKNAIELD